MPSTHVSTLKIKVNLVLKKSKYSKENLYEIARGCKMMLRECLYRVFESVSSRHFKTKSKDRRGHMYK